MKSTLRNTGLALAVAGATAQSFPGVTIPATNGSLPKAGSNGCAEGFFPGTDTVIYTVPYTYKEVLSIVSNFTNLTWSGSPDNSVTTNNTDALKTNDWTPGSARFYDLDGAHVIETLFTYEKPADGPYVEQHTLAPLSIPSANLTAYAPFDAANWTSVCEGKATWVNQTVNFCANNATVAAAALHMIHLADAQGVEKILGGKKFESCEALGATGSAPRGGWGGVNGTSNETTSTMPPSTSSAAPSGSAMPTTSSPPTNGASATTGSIVGIVGAAFGIAAFAMI